MLCSLGVEYGIRYDFRLGGVTASEYAGDAGCGHVMALSAYPPKCISLALSRSIFSFEYLSLHCCLTGSSPLFNTKVIIYSYLFPSDWNSFLFIALSTSMVTDALVGLDR